MKSTIIISICFSFLNFSNAQDKHFNGSDSLKRKELYEKVLLLEKDLESAKDINTKLLNTVYWTIGGFMGLFLAIIAGNAFSQYRINKTKLENMFDEFSRKFSSEFESGVLEPLILEARKDIDNRLEKNEDLIHYNEVNIIENKKKIVQEKINSINSFGESFDKSHNLILEYINLIECNLQLINLKKNASSSMKDQFYDLYFSDILEEMQKLLPNKYIPSITKNRLIRLLERFPARFSQQTNGILSSLNKKYEK